MARQNEVRLYGCLAEAPKITTDDKTGAYIRGVFHIALVKPPRETGEEEEKEQIKYDWPLVLSNDPDMIARMSKLKIYDIVEIKGTYTTRKITKNSFCKNCGAQNRIEGKISYVDPVFLAKRNPGKESLTQKEAIQEIKENRDISNNIFIMGNLCSEVNYFHNGRIQTSAYQIAADRKRFIKSDSPENKTDFPVIRSFGKQAKLDSICIHKKSLIFVEGYLHSREFERTSTCEACGKDYQWKDNIIEVVPFAVEYLADYIDPNNASEAESQMDAQKGEDLLNRILG